jgi:TPR repeat protein
MRNRSLLVWACLGPALAGCLSEEEKQAVGRQRTETAFVESLLTTPAASVGETLDVDPTLANSIRMVRGPKRSYPAESALTFALKHARTDVIAVLLDKGADPNMPQADGASPLSVAIGLEAGRADKVAMLLGKGADPEKVFAFGSALHHAASIPEAAAAQVFPMLLAGAAGVGHYDATGRMPLHAAASSANPAVIRLLVAKGADVNVRTKAPGQGHGVHGEVAGATPLAIVARDRQIAAAATLCALGADPDLADATAASARQVAARIAAEKGKGAKEIDGDLLRHRNMAAFLAKGASCDALLARSRRGESIAQAEVLRIANESECGAGWGWACGQAAWAYHRGEGAAKNGAKALELFRYGCETARTASTWSCGMAGIIHVEGLSVTKDPAEGARWLAKGCETPDPARADEQACNRLGLLYAAGSGVPKDPARARALFKRACDQKYEKACANLAKQAGVAALFTLRMGVV